MKKIALGASVAAVIAVLCARNLPDLRRYLRIRAM